MAEKLWPPSGGHHRLAGLYNLKKTLGRGHFAVVRLAQHVFTGQNVAIKVIDKTKLDKTSMDHLYHEVTCMKLVQHPNVVHLYEVIETSSKLYLILELGDGGDMYDYIMKHDQGLDEEQAKEYFAQILCAISYCHKMHVVHRDLKPENIVFFESQGLVKLTDFGFSNRYDPGKKLSTSCGSLAYSAPEILLGEEYDAQAVDVWSLGVILYMLVCGEAPFNEANDSETLTNIMDCKYTVLDHVDKDCRDLIQNMIIREPGERLKLEEIRSHCWLKDCATLRDDVYNSTPVLTRDLISEEMHLRIIDQMIQGKLAQHDEIEEAINDNKYNHITSTYFLLAHRSLEAQQKVLDVRSLPSSDNEMAMSEVRTVPINVSSGSNNTLLPHGTENYLPTLKTGVPYGSSPPIQASVIPVLQTGLHAPTLPTHNESDMNEDSSPASSNSSLYFSHPSLSHLVKGDKKMSPPFPRDHLTITPRHGFSVAKGGIDTLIEEEERCRSQAITDDEDESMMTNQEDESITCAQIINPVQLASQFQRASLQMKKLKKRKSAPVLNEICEENEAEGADMFHGLDGYHLQKNAKHPHRRRHTASLCAVEKQTTTSKTVAELIDFEVFHPEESLALEDTVPELQMDTLPAFTSRQGRALRRGNHKSSGSETSDDDSESRRESRTNLHATILGSLNRPRRDSSGDRDGNSGGGRGTFGGRRNSGSTVGYGCGKNADSDMSQSENAANQNGGRGEMQDESKEMENEVDNNNFNNSAIVGISLERCHFRCITPNILMPVSSSDVAAGAVLNNSRGGYTTKQPPTLCNRICNIPEKRSKSAESNQSLRSNHNSSQTSSARSSSSSLSMGYRCGRILTGRRSRKNSRSTMSDTGLVLRWNHLKNSGIPNSSSSSATSLSITVPSNASSRWLCNSPVVLHRPHSEGNVTDERIGVGGLRSKSQKRQSRSTSLPRPNCFVRNNLNGQRAASCGPYISHGAGRKRQCPSGLAAPMMSIQPCIPESQMTSTELDVQPPITASDTKESNIKRSNISLASSTCSASKFAVDPINELVLSPMAEETPNDSLTGHGLNTKFFKRTKQSTGSSISTDSLQEDFSKYIEVNASPTPTTAGRIKMTFFSADGIFKRKVGSKASRVGQSSSKRWIENRLRGRRKINSIPDPHWSSVVHANSFGADNSLAVRKSKPDCCVIM